MRNYLIVALGAGLGGTARYGLSRVVQSVFPPNFPYGTLAVNLVGSFLLGMIMYLFDAEVLIRPETRLFFAVGFCGALTTFSTFSYETMNLLRAAEFLLAGTNILLNVVLTLFGIGLAFVISKNLLGV